MVFYVSDTNSPISFCNNPGTLEYAQYQEVLNNDPTIVGVFFFTNPIAMDQNIPENKYYQFIQPLVGPEGKQYVTYNPTQPRGYWFITADCKNPDLAFQIGDSLYCEEAYLRNRVGVPEVDWTYADAEVYEKMEYSEDMIIWKEINYPWQNLSNTLWYLAGPSLCEQPNYLPMWNGDESFYNYRRWKGLLYYMDIMPKTGEYVPTLSFTPEETEELAEIRTAIDTYREECRTRFILGDMDIETEWDSYLKELDGMGLARYIEICQTAYNRFLGI